MVYYINTHALIITTCDTFTVKYLYTAVLPLSSVVHFKPILNLVYGYIEFGEHL